MRQSENYQLNLPEAEDSADIEKVSEAIEDIDGILADKLDGENISATLDDLGYAPNQLRAADDWHTKEMPAYESANVLDKYVYDLSDNLGWDGIARIVEDNIFKLRAFVIRVLSSMITTVGTPTISDTSGTSTTKSYVKSGRVVQLYLSGGKSQSVEPGDNIYEGTLGNEVLRPKVRVTTGSYYNTHACNAILDPNGKIKIRNSSSSAFTPSDGVSVSFTYVLDHD